MGRVGQAPRPDEAREDVEIAIERTSSFRQAPRPETYGSTPSLIRRDQWRSLRLKEDESCV